MDMPEGRFVELHSDEERKALEERNRTLLRSIDPQNAERRIDSGPAIFEVGETVEIKGAQFKILRIGTEMLMLEPMKG